MESMSRSKKALNDHVLLLLDSCNAYDCGAERQYKHIANQLWIIFGDRGQKALSKQTTDKESGDMTMYNSCDLSTPEGWVNVLDTHNMIFTQTVISNGSVSGKYFPILDGFTDNESPLLLKNWYNKKDWWEKQKVLLRPRGLQSEYTREALIKVVRDKIGGAHFDPKEPELETAYGDFAGPHSVTGPFSSPDEFEANLAKTGIAGISVGLNNAALAAQIRQIGHEALRSFQREGTELGIEDFQYAPFSSQHNRALPFP